MISIGSQAQSGEGHYHGKRISEEEAKTVAIEVRDDHVANGKIDNSWQNTEVASIAQRNYDGHLEWAVTFQNDNIEDTANRNLYIFLTLGGELTGINYTGK